VNATFPTQTIRSSAIVLLIALPWLNPFATGPAPSVVPLAFSWACAAGLLLWGWWPDAPHVAPAWLWAGLVSSVIGVVQYLNLEGAMSPWINQAEPGQAFANLRQRNQFATLTVMALAALLWRPPSTSKSGLPKSTAAQLACAALLAIGTAASSSRTGLAQIALLCALAALWGGWRQPPARGILISALGAYAIAAVGLPRLIGLSPADHGIFARLAVGDEVCSSRTTLWTNVMHLIAQRPWQGWGWGELDYAHYATLYPGDRFCDILDNAHNLPLHVAVEVGLPWAVALFGGLLCLLVRAKPWSEADPAKRLAWTVLCIVGVHSLLEYPLWYGPFQVACLLSMGLLIQPLHRVLSAAWCKGLGAVLLVFCIYANWDYHRISQIYLPAEQREAVYRDNTLGKINASWLFRSQVQFAELTTTSLTPQNADRLYGLALELLHFSPEPRVIEKLIESAVMLGRDDEARFHLVRFKAAFPDAHAKWAATFMPPR
jgi:O-antigen ligase